MSDPVRTAWAQAIENDEFISIRTCSGYRSCRSDPKGKEHRLVPDADNVTLGAAVFDCLEKSRFVTPEDDPDLYDFRQFSIRYAEWLSDLIDTYRYKSKRQLLKNMKSCMIERRQGIVVISPSHHKALDTWTGLDEVQDVTIGSDRPAQEIGQALRLAFDRCT